MSFHIVVLLLGLATGEPIAPPLVVAEPDYKTMAECEEDRTGDNFKSALEDLRNAIAEHDDTLPDFEFKTRCIPFDMRGKPLPSRDAGEKF